MFEFVCICGNSIVKDMKWIGEWNGLWVYHEGVMCKTSVPGIFNKCKVFGIECTECKIAIGYYFIECPKELKELEGKYGLICKKGKGILSSYLQTERTFVEGLEINGTISTIFSSILGLEAEALKAFMLLKHFETKINLCK